MHEQTYQSSILPHVLLASSLAFAVAGTFLLPGGSTLPHLFFDITLWCAAAALAALAYAMTAPAAEAADPSLRPEIAWLATRSERIPEGALDGREPLLALVAEGQVPHPDLIATLAPYFADPSVAYVQGATRYDGEGGIAQAYRGLAAIAAWAERERSKLGAVRLSASGAVVCREAAREVYRPGDTWETLGMRLVAAGYVGQYTDEPVVLAWAPESLPQMGVSLVGDTMAALMRLVHSARLPLPLEARAQYAAGALGMVAVWSAALMAAFSALSLIFLDVGPVILTSPGAWVGDALAAVAGGVVLYTWMKAVAINPLAPAALVLCAAYQAMYDNAYAIATGPLARQLWSSTTQAYRTALATVRADGNGGSAPAGTPARS